MRTNQASFALSIGMGIIVLLIGFLALSATGLVGFAAGDARENLDKQLKKEAEDLGEHDISYGDTSSATNTYIPSSSKEASAIAAGDMLFKNNCAQCHAVNDKVVGPALAGISKRRPTPWLIKWVKNSSKVIASGDEYAVKLFDEYGKQQMPAFPQLSDQDITIIVAWVKSQEGSGMIDDSSLAENTAAN
ncbi:c-type cytochrome [Hymenobacter arcticus]